MNLTIPSSGFCVIADIRQDLKDLRSTFESHHAKTLDFPSDNLLFASWQENPDQGLWSDGTNAVAWDMDLTNLVDLAGFVGEQDVGSIDQCVLIWRLYQKFGSKFVDLFRGPFAFALWDGIQKELFVYTDPYGLKPVVYTENSTRLYAASRIRHLLWADPSLKTINPDAIFHYLFFQAVCKPFDNLQKH